MAILSSNKLEAMSMRALLVHEIRDMYDAEHQILDALPKMIEAAQDNELIDALEEHRQETEEHVVRLEDCLNLLDEKAERETCDGMKGIIKEGEHVLKGKMEPDVRNAAIIAAAQRVEHYEIAGYGCARAYANALDMQDIAELLETTLDEESNADKTLTDIATRVNKQAMEASPVEEQPAAV